MRGPVDAPGHRRSARARSSRTRTSSGGRATAASGPRRTCPRGTRPRYRPATATDETWWKRRRSIALASSTACAVPLDVDGVVALRRRRSCRRSPRGGRSGRSCRGAPRPRPRRGRAAGSAQVADTGWIRAGAAEARERSASSRAIEPLAHEDVDVAVALEQRRQEMPADEAGRPRHEIGHPRSSVRPRRAGAGPYELLAPGLPVTAGVLPAAARLAARLLGLVRGLAGFLAACRAGPGRG